MRFKDKENFPERFVVDIPLSIGGDIVATPNGELGLMFNIAVGIDSTLANPINLRKGDEVTFILTQGGGTLAFGNKFLFIGGSYTFSTGTAQVDTLTLSGTVGTANVTAAGVTKLATYNTSLTQTATDFVTAHATAYLAVGITLTSSGADLIFTAETAGFSWDDTAIAGVVTDLGGDIVLTTPNVSPVDVLKGVFDGTNVLIHTQAQAIA